MKIVKLKEICDIIAGQSPPSSTYNNDCIGLPFFQGKSDFGYIYPNIRQWCSIPLKIALPNDILISVRAPVGPTNICNQKACIGRGLSAIRVKEGVDFNFIFRFFRSIESKLSSSGRGSTFDAITQDDLKNLELLLPSLEDQIRIAAILDKADEIRQKLRESLKLCDEYLRSVFLDMFGDPVTNPKGWEVRNLGELTNRIVVGHVGPTTDGYRQDGIPFLRTQNIRPMKITYQDLHYISTDFHNKLKNSIIHANDILISRVGVNRGMVAVVPYELDGANCANIIVVGSDTKFQSLFIAFYMNLTFGKSSLYGYSVGSAHGVVNTSIVKIWPINYPPITLQTKFADIVTKIEELKAKLQAQLTESDNLFNSLMQRAFRGEL